MINWKILDSRLNFIIIVTLFTSRIGNPKIQIIINLTDLEQFSVWT